MTPEGMTEKDWSMLLLRALKCPHLNAALDLYRSGCPFPVAMTQAALHLSDALKETQQIACDLSAMTTSPRLFVPTKGTKP